MNSNVLVFLEHDGGSLKSEMAKLVAKGNELAHALGGVAVGALIGDISAELLAEARALKCHELLLVGDPQLREYQPELFQAALQTIIDEASPRVVIFHHSYVSTELAPALAYRCKASIASNCLDVAAKDFGIEVIRPYLRERCWARIALVGAPPYFVALQRFSVRQDVCANRETTKITQIGFTPPSRVRLRCAPITRRAESEDIAKAERIVAVGRGIGDRANLKIVAELADALGASVACSRPIADLGWLPVEKQVGISGKTVSPKVYIACGISGESQHVAGMKDSSLIIAINSDPRANIFQVAHCGIVADLMRFLPVLIAAARETKERKADREKHGT